MSTMREPIDEMLDRAIRTRGIEAAVVAWDLRPKWNGHVDNCRWTETLALYEGLAASKHLPPMWIASASRRLDELRSRSRPSARSQLPKLEPHSVLPLCMDLEFESILSDEAGVRQALGVAGRPIRGWPKRWGARSARPDKELLSPAIAAIRRASPRPDSARTVRRDWATGKNDWALYILQQFADDAGMRELVRRHVIVQRLAEVAPE